MVGQYRNVFATLAQRRQPDRQDVQPVEEIFAELAFRDHALAGSRFDTGDDAHIHRDRGCRRRVRRRAPEHAKQLHLHGRRHVVDIVEEDRAAMRHLEAARAILDRAGERSALVAEELRLDERLGQDRAADRHERPAPARAVVMDQAGDDFLACAGLADDEHVALAVGNHAQEIEDRAHSPAAPDHDGVRAKTPLHAVPDRTCAPT